MPASSRRDFLKQAGVALLALAYLPRALADDPIRLQRAELVKRQDAYHLIGGFSVTLNKALDEALQRGVTLTFLQQFEADRPRDFWFAEDVVVVRRQLRLSFHALLRYYQLSIDESPPTTHEHLHDALRALGDFQDWRVIEAKALERKYVYRGRVRMSLDTSQLPKPLQVNAVVSSRWDVDSGWHEWPFKP
jgi:hypothetical protein